MTYLSDNKTQKASFTVDQVVALIVNGFHNTYRSLELSPKPGESKAKVSLSTLFAKSDLDAQIALKRFVTLSSIESHPETHHVKEGEYLPSLGLGSVLMDSKNGFWLCIQASCDSVRVKESRGFLFIPLEKSENNSQQVIPHANSEGEIEYISLGVGSQAYTKAKSIEFEPSESSERVMAEAVGKDGTLVFKSKANKKFVWLADLKHYHALNIAQSLARQMSRLGFDQFEPFREPNSY